MNGRGPGARGRRAAEAAAFALALAAVTAWSALAAAASPAPGASPSPSVLPSVQPTALPSPSPSAPPASPGPNPSPSLSPSPGPAPTPTPTRSALPAPGGQVAILSSSTLQITGLQSMSVVDASTSSGPIRVIELKMAGSTIGGLDLLDPCAGHVRMHTTATQQHGTGGMSIHATAVQVTMLGVTIILAASDLPVGPLTLPGVWLPPLPTDVGFTSVTMYVLTISAGSAGLVSASVTPAAC